MEKIIGVGGGAMSRTTTGRWVIREGKIAPAASIRRYGDLSCRDDQATVALEVGDVICTAYGSLDGPDITCLRVVAINDLEALTEAVNGDGRGYPAAWEYPSEGLDTYHNRDGGMFARLPASA